MPPKSARQQPASNEKKPDKPAAAPKQQSKKASKETSEEVPESKLAKIRPKRRLFFFIVFVLSCVWIVTMYEPCKMKDKEKQDCGWSGIDEKRCRFYACFTKGGGERVTKIIKLNKTKGEKFGLKIAQNPAGAAGGFRIQNVEAGGAIARHNQNPGEEEPLMVGDIIAKINGKTGNSMKKVLTSSDANSHKFEIKRSQLPAILQQISNMHPRLGFVETVLSAPPTLRWLRTFGHVGGVGFSVWYLSGYPVASLPMYMMLSAAVTVRLNGCCFDAKVGKGVAQCYMPIEGTPQEIVMKTIESTRALVEKVRKKPKKYFGFLTSWQQDVEWLWKKA